LKGDKGTKVSFQTFCIGVYEFLKAINVFFEGKWGVGEREIEWKKEIFLRIFYEIMHFENEKD